MQFSKQKCVQQKMQLEWFLSWLWIYFAFILKNKEKYLWNWFVTVAIFVKIELGFEW